MNDNSRNVDLMNYLICRVVLKKKEKIHFNK